MPLPVQPFLRDLCALPHRGAATPEGAEAARLLQTYLTNLGATIRTEPFQTPKTYATVIYWLIGGLLAGLALMPVTPVAVGFVWYFAVLAWLYFNWRYSFIIKFPVQHTAHNVIGHWPARTTGRAANGSDVRTVILMAHYDTAPVDGPDGLAEQAEEAWVRGDISDAEFDGEFDGDICPAGGPHTPTNDSSHPDRMTDPYWHCDECGANLPAPERREP